MLHKVGQSSFICDSIRADSSGPPTKMKHYSIVSKKLHEVENYDKKFGCVTANMRGLTWVISLCAFTELTAVKHNLYVNSVSRVKKLIMITSPKFQSDIFTKGKKIIKLSSSVVTKSGVHFTLPIQTDWVYSKGIHSLISWHDQCDQLTTSHKATTFISLCLIFNHKI